MNKLLCNAIAIAWWPGAAIAAAPAAENIPAGNGWFSFLVPVIAVTAAMLALLWWLRRGHTLRGGSGPLRIVQAVAVGSRERVVVLDAQGRRLLLGVTSNRVELIAELRAEGNLPERD